MQSQRDCALRQERLLELGSVYRGWNRRKLGEALGRDPTKLFPANGNPKLDYLVKLADVLDWPVGVITEAIWTDRDVEQANVPEGDVSFDELDLACLAAHREGRFADMAGIAKQMWSQAETAEQRGLACLRESGGWDGLGRYTNQLQVVQQGLRESPLPRDLRLLLRGNLANSYYTLWHLLEAKAIARDILSNFDETAPDGRRERAVHAFAHYVLGHTHRRLIEHEPDRTKKHAEQCADVLREAQTLYLKLAEEFDHDPWRGIAHTCEGGVIEVEVELEKRSALDAIAALDAGLEEVVSTDDGPVGDLLESYGWWCIFGCNIAMRHLTGSELQRHMAVFTNKGYEIAERLNNWSMRERLFTLEFLQRQRLNEHAGINVGWMIDHDDLRVLVGTMGRFPEFRRTGWQILETATLVDEK